MEDNLGLILLVAIGLFAGALVGAACGWLFKRLLPRFWHWLAALLVPVLFYFPFGIGAIKFVDWLVRHDPANKDVSGFKQSAAIIFIAPIIVVPALLSSIVVCFLMMQRKERRWPFRVK